MIPKKIFQTHEWDYEDLPENFKKLSNTWKNLNPGWDYIYHNKDERANFILKYYPHLYDGFICDSGIFQADVWRYCIIHKYGGVYADVDSICVKPLDYMLESYSGEDLLAMDEKSVGPILQGKGYVNNSNFAAIKGSKILEKVIGEVHLRMMYSILNQTKEKHVLNTLPYTFYSFTKYASNIRGLVFDAAENNGRFKEELGDYEVNFYGELIKYREYLNRIGAVI
jgi:hypothetical protein